MKDVNDSQNAEEASTKGKADRKKNINISKKKPSENAFYD